MRGGPARTTADVLAHARAVAVRESAGTPRPGTGGAPVRHEPAPAPAGNAERGHSCDRHDSLGSRLAAALNLWADAKDDVVIDALIAEARQIGWLR